MQRLLVIVKPQQFIPLLRELELKMVFLNAMILLSTYLQVNYYLATISKLINAANMLRPFIFDCIVNCMYEPERPKYH